MYKAAVIDGAAEYHTEWHLSNSERCHYFLPNKYRKGNKKVLIVKNRALKCCFIANYLLATNKSIIFAVVQV